MKSSMKGKILAKLAVQCITELYKTGVIIDGIIHVEHQ